MKIKKFLLMIVVILSIVIGYFLNKNFNYNLMVRYHSYQDYVGILEDKETIPISISPKGKTFSPEQFVNQLIKFDTEGTFVIHYVEANDIYNMFHFIVYTHNNNIIEDFSNHQASGLSFDNENETGYYASDLDDQQATDHIEIIDNGLFLTYREKVRIMPVLTGIEKLQERLGSSADFMLFFYSDNNKEFEQKFSAFLEESGMSSQISYTNFYGGYAGAQINILMANGIENINRIIICLLVIYILFMVIEIYRKKKTIMIQNLHGISLLKIVSRLLIKMLIMHFIVFVIGLIISITLWTGGKVYQEKELLEQLRTVILLMAGSCFVIFIGIYVLSYLLLGIKNMKKSENSIKSLIMISAMKIIFVIIISSGLISMIKETYQDIKTYYFFNKYEDILENLGEISLYYSDPDDMNKVFEYYLKNDGYFADFSIYEGNTYEFLKENFGEDMDEEELQEASLEYPVIYANVNYIESYDRPIYKSDGSRLDLQKIKENVMLVPENCTLTDFTKYSNQINDEADIIRIKSSGMYIDYTYNTEDFIYYNPILYIVTQSNSLIYKEYLTIPLNKVSDKDIAKTVEKLTHKKVRIESGKEKMEVRKYGIKARLIDTGVILILYLMIYGSIVYQSIYIYVEEFKKILIIQYLFGKKKIERYGSLFIFDIIIYMIPLGYCVMIQHLSMIDLLKLYCITYLGEVIMMYIMMHHIEKGNVSIVLKGESQL